MYLFDTNILSELIKKKPNDSLIGRLSDVPSHIQFTSCICSMELRCGSKRRTDHQTFWKRIEDEILSLVRILPVTQDTAITAGDIAADLSTRGRGISPEDLLIAATAVESNMTLVTANRKHFRFIKELTVENWIE